jgi:hypothetical protein
MGYARKYTWKPAEPCIRAKISQRQDSGNLYQSVLKKDGAPSFLPLKSGTANRISRFAD